MIIRKTIASFSALILGIVLSLTLATGVIAQQTPAATPKDDRVSGTVKLISKDSSTITVQKDNVARMVVYSKDTKFTNRNKPGSLDDVKEGRKVVCLGKFDEKKHLIAARIDVRTEQ